MGMARISTDRFERVAAPPLPGVVVPFPGAKSAPAPVSEPLAAAPQPGERPTILPSSVRDWLRVALIASVLIHGAAYVAFNVSFEDDLERASGAAAAASSDGTITIPIEVVIESTLPAAPASTDATASDAERAVPTPTEIDPAVPAEFMPSPPEPAPVVLPEAKIEMPAPPEPAPVVLPKAVVELPPPPKPAPVVLPTKQQAMELALPEEEIAKPVEAKTAAIPQAPAAPQAEEAPPMPLPRVAPPEVREKPREEPKQAARPPSPPKSAPARAAAPSRAASSGSAGRAGAGGAAETGGRAAMTSYFARVQAHLSRHRVYPQEARANGISGVARVVFSLGRDGRVLSVSLARGSGHGVLDQAALAMVRRAAPFPPFPPAIAASRLEMGAPIRFDLR